MEQERFGELCLDIERTSDYVMGFYEKWDEWMGEYDIDDHPDLTEDQKERLDRLLTEFDEKFEKLSNF
jgi:hypothetical protein